VGLPFAIYGLTPQTVDKEKLEILTWAGLNRVRMGVQSGSQRILNWYKRSASVAQIEKAAGDIAAFSKYHIPPAYDIILDNPIETKQDVIDTLRLLYRLPRPYFLYIFSLRLIPNTEMEQIAREEGLDIRRIDDYYSIPKPSFANLMVYLLTFYRPPKWLFEKMLTRVKPYGEKQTLYPLAAFVVRFFYLVNRGFSHLRFMDFSVITGIGGYIFWRIGIVQFWQSHFVPKPKQHKMTIPEQ
jgi:anaerobic magnesium-protoporphyrin IX monomethyl ester cyclase